MPAKRCIETKNMCLLFVDYCKDAFIPKGKPGNGYRREKVSFIPKGKLENGYRREKVSFIPKGKFKNGYRKKKWIEIPKRKGKWTGNLLLENEIGKI